MPPFFSTWTSNQVKSLTNFAFEMTHIYSFFPFPRHVLMQALGISHLDYYKVLSLTALPAANVFPIQSILHIVFNYLSLQYRGDDITTSQELLVTLQYLQNSTKKAFKTFHNSSCTFSLSFSAFIVHTISNQVSLAQSQFQAMQEQSHFCTFTLVVPSSLNVHTLPLTNFLSNRQNPTLPSRSNSNVLKTNQLVFGCQLRHSLAT